MIKTVVKRKKKDPLTDLETLNQIGKAATKKARSRAFKNRGFVIISNTKGIFRLYSNGQFDKIQSALNLFQLLEKI